MGYSIRSEIKTLHHSIKLLKSLNNNSSSLIIILGDAKTAAELYISARQFNKAIDIVGKNNWPEMLLEIVRKLDKADREALSKCGEMFRRMGLPNFAAEAYEKMGNIEELVELRMEAKQWDEVFALAKRYPDIDNKAHFRYGQWLAENDRFEEAQKGSVFYI
jgi:intraflagellar transport protein 122